MFTPSQSRYDPVPFLLSQVPARSLQLHHHHSHSWYFPFHFRSSSSLSQLPHASAAPFRVARDVQCVGPLRYSEWLAAGDAATTQGRGFLLKSCRRIHRTAPRGARRPAALVPSETPSGWPQAMLPPLRAEVPGWSRVVVSIVLLPVVTRRGSASLRDSKWLGRRCFPWCAASGSAVSVPSELLQVVGRRRCCHHSEAEARRNEVPPSLHRSRVVVL